MDQSKDEDEKEIKPTNEPITININKSNEFESACEESNDSIHHNTEDNYFQVSRKRTAETSAGAPKPKIKKKLHAVISELKSLKEDHNLFSAPTPEVGAVDPNLSQNLGQNAAVYTNLSLVDTHNEGSSDLPVETEIDQLESSDNTNPFNVTRQFTNTDINSHTNIFRPMLSDGFSASASPKVKFKSKCDYPSETVSSISPSLVEEDDDFNVWSSKRRKLVPDDQSFPEDSCDTNSETVNNLEMKLGSQTDEIVTELDEDASDFASVANSRSNKVDSIPVAKVDPLREPSSMSDDTQSQFKNDSDTESEKASKGKSDSDDENSDYDDINKKNLMGGSTGLSARPKVKNMRKNIRDILADDKLEEDTLAAQKEEQERLHRLQEKQAAMREYLEQQQVERMVAEVAEAAEAVTAAEAVQEVEEAQVSSQTETIVEVKKEPQTAEDDIVVLSSEESDSDSKESEPDEDSTNETKPKLLLPLPLLKPKLEMKSEKDSESETEESESDSDSDVVVLSHSEDEGDTDEDVNNCGEHVNDEFNTPDVNGRVLVNVGHPEKEDDIFLPAQLAAAIKPHQIGGLRFLYDNIVESLEQFKSSNGFGCILAHSMGLGKTLQVISLTDVFVRNTEGKHILIIVPINTLQNWVTEYNHWLPEEVPAGLPEGTDFRPRNFKVYLLNDGQKTIKARAKVIDDWHREGGVLLMGYEMYRQLSMKKAKKPKKKRRKNVDELVDIEEEDSQKEYLDEIYKALVRPGPDLIICDEGHRIKNAHANISQALKSIRTKRRIVLTGYPLQNNLLEYWCMVDFVRPNYLGTKTEFSNMFERPIQNGQCVDSTPQDVKLMRYRAHVLHSLLEGFVQRRGHSVLAATLPEKHEHVILCRLMPIQRKLYAAYMAELTVNKGMANPLKAFAICCKIWNHPDILYNLVMKRANEGFDLDLDEVVGKSGNKAKKATAPKPADKKKGGKQNQHIWNPPSDSIAHPNDLSIQSSKSSDTSSTKLPQGSFQSNTMGPPQIIPQQQQRLPMNNTSNEHSNVNMGFSYPNMYNMPTQNAPFMNQIQYPWGYNQGYPPDSTAPYMPSYNMYPQQYGHPMQQNQQEIQSYPMTPPGHMAGIQPTTQQVCGQSLHNQNLSLDQRSSNVISDSESQEGGTMNEQQMESMKTNLVVKEEESQMMPLPHISNNANMEQNLSNNMNIVQDVRSAVGCQMSMQDMNCKFNYMAVPSPKISDQMNNLALDQKEFSDVNRTIAEDLKPVMPSTLIQPHFIKKDEIPNLQRMQDCNEKTDVDEKKDDFRKEENKKDEVSLEWAESYFKDYIPGLLETSTKFQIFFRILHESLAVEDRILVFSQSLFTLSQLEEFLQKSVIPGTTDEKWAKNRTYYRLDGSTTAQERDKLISDFNVNPNVRLFLVSTRAGSLGINLVGANRVIVFDASFNPCHDTQAVCRVYRYGQRKDCHIYRMVTDNSLERRIYDRQVNKQGISDRIVDEMNPDAHLSSKEISNLLVEKEEDPTEEDFSDKANNLSDQILKDILKNESHLVTRAPFKHESLLVDRKDKKLSNAEKRLAKRSYELEKQANISYSRPSYSSFYPKTGGIQAALGTKIGGVMYAKPVGTVRPMQVDPRRRVDAGMAHRPNILTRRSNTQVEILAKQGVTVQQITVPKDVSIPTNSGDAKPIQLKRGQSVMVIKTQKGVYLRLSDGKIVAIRIPPGNEDPFGLPISQGSVTIVPTAFASRGRSVAGGRGGSSIRRGRPPLSAQYALGQVVPKGINKSQMAVRIIRKPIPSNRGGKNNFQTIAVPVSKTSTVLNKSVVITPAKSGTKMNTNDSKASRNVQITAVPPKHGGLASIGGTSGLNRRLSRNTNLLFQQTPGFKTNEKTVGTGFKMNDLHGTKLQLFNSDSSEDDSMPSNEDSPKAADLSRMLASNEKPETMVDGKDMIKTTPAIDVATEDKFNLMANSPLTEHHSQLEREVNSSSEFPPADKTCFAPMPLNNAKIDPVAESMLHPLSQLSNLVPPDVGGTQGQMTTTFNTMPQTNPNFSQPVYSNNQLFQPYLQQTIAGSSGTSHVPTQLQMPPSEPVKPWSRVGEELNINSIDSMQGMNSHKPESGFLTTPTNTSVYQSSSLLKTEGNKLSTSYQTEGNKLSTSYQSDGTHISQAGTTIQRSAENEKDPNNSMSQMLNHGTPQSLTDDSPLSLSNLLPETISGDVPVNPSAPLNYMNYSSAFRRVEYPTGEVPNLVHTPTTSEMGAASAQPYSSPATTPSASFADSNPHPYSQYPSYGNHSFRTPSMNPPGYPYGSQFAPYGLYGGLNTQGQPQQPGPPTTTQQYPVIPNQENYSYNSGTLPPYTPGIGNFAQGPYPPM